MNDTIVTRQDNKVVEFSDEQIDLIKNMYAKDTSDNQLKLFLYIAKKAGLDPLAKQIHCVLRKNKNTGEMDMSIQTGIDGYRLIADRTNKLAGIDDAIYDNEDSINPKIASVTVYKFVNGQKCAFTASARWKEYAPTGSQDFMWKKMPRLMLAKCAESLALRKAFPADLSGVYSDEEMAQADDNRPGVEDNNKSGFKPLPEKYKSQNSNKPEENKTSEKEYVCAGKNCGTIINQKINDFSMKKFGMPLCFNCQKVIGAPVVSNSTVSNTTSSFISSSNIDDKGVDDFEKSLLSSKEKHKL